MGMVSQYMFLLISKNSIDLCEHEHEKNRWKLQVDAYEIKKAARSLLLHISQSQYGQ